jgi:hypothetical protein
MIHLIHSKNLCKCHNVTLPITTIKAKIYLKKIKAVHEREPFQVKEQMLNIPGHKGNANQN